MTKKRRRTTKTLTCGWSHTEERPRPGGGGYPVILVQVKLSNRELIHSLGINCQKKKKQKEQTASHSSEQESIQSSAQSQKGPVCVSVQKQSEKHLLKNPRIHMNVHSVFIFLTFSISFFPSSFFNSLLVTSSVLVLF